MLQLGLLEALMMPYYERNLQYIRQILDGDIMPGNVNRLGDFGEIPLVTIGDSAFSQYHGYLKCITRMHKINSKSMSAKGYMEQGWLQRMHMEY